MILRSKKEITKFRILVEIAGHQPDVMQKEIAQRIGITPQAVSEYIKELVSEGHLFSDGRMRYRITKIGVEWVLERAIELKKYARFVMEDIVSHVSVATAIASGKFKKGDAVSLIMENGLLYAGTQGGCDWNYYFGWRGGRGRGSDRSKRYNRFSSGHYNYLQSAAC